MAIDILLATYNGERFIQQQLFSLLMQTYTDWCCYIHDDGSSDNTVSIVKSFSEKDSRFVFVDDKIKCGGPANNFLHLLKFSSAEYCCFCDQDDIWLDNKLQKYIDAISAKDNSKPQVVFFNSHLWNSDSDSITGNATLAFPKNIESLLFLNCGIQGCAGVFNKEMVHHLRNPLEHNAMHDHYLTLLGCSSIGEISYVHENTMLYRQHSNNVTGKAFGSIKEKYKSVFTVRKAVVSKEHLIAVKDFYELYKSVLSEDNIKKFDFFIKSKNFNIFKKIFFIVKYGFNIYGSRIKLIVKIFMRPYIENGEKK